MAVVCASCGGWKGGDGYVVDGLNKSNAQRSITSISTSCLCSQMMPVYSCMWDRHRYTHNARPQKEGLRVSTISLNTDSEPLSF